MKKIDMSKQLYEKYIAVFQCPSCRENLHIEAHSLVCENRHTFDISKKGCVNFCSGQKPDERYGKPLFANRSSVFAAGFFQPLYDTILDLLPKQENLLLADLGCGEGSGLRYLLPRFPHAAGIGADLSKHGVETAASGDSANIFWLVADIAKMPLRENSVDVILNILSPANYSEFNRIQKPSGAIIKVIPESGYLKEIRAHFYQGGDNESYSNQLIYEHFMQSYPHATEQKLQYAFEADEKTLTHIARMTPLSWNHGEQAIDEFVKSSNGAITADFKILKTFYH